MIKWIDRVRCSSGREQNAFAFEVILLISLAMCVKLGIARLSDPFAFAPERPVVAEGFRPIGFARLVPSKALLSATFHRTISAALAVFASLWAIRVLPRWTSILTVFLLCMQMSLMYTFNTVLHHRYHLLAQVLIIFALHWVFVGGGYGYWFGRERQTYPRWVAWMAMFVVGLSYTLSGIAKLVESSGLWWDGISLQAHLWKTWMLAGDHGSSSTQLGRLVWLLLQRRDLAAISSTMTLILECGCVIAVFVPSIRLLFGFGLIAFHIGALLLLGIFFPANIFYVTFFFAGGFELLERIGEMVCSRNVPLAPKPL